MADLLFLGVTVSFFALMALLVRGCDRVIGPDPIDLSPDDGVDDGAEDRHVAEVATDAAHRSAVRA